MARLSESERLIWQQAAAIKDKDRQLDQLTAEYLELHRVLAALARRAGGKLELTEDELAAAGQFAAVGQVTLPDGRVVIVVVSDGPEPGIAG